MSFSTPRYIRKHFPFGKNFKVFADFQPMTLNIFADFAVCHGLDDVKMGSLGTGLGLVKARKLGL